MMDIQTQVLDWVRAQPRSAGIDVEPTTNLISGGILGSLELLSLVTWIEAKFHRRLTHDDIDLKSFETVEDIIKLIGRDPPRETVN